MTDWTKHEQWVAQRRPRKSGPSFPTSCQVKVPRDQLNQTIAGVLSDRFRSGATYAYSYDGGQWYTWNSDADWDATERSTPEGRKIRRPDLAAQGHGPTVWEPDALASVLRLTDTAPAKRPGKAAYVDMLRKIRDGVDWSVDELDQLLAVA